MSLKAYTADPSNLLKSNAAPSAQRSSELNQNPKSAKPSSFNPCSLPKFQQAEYSSASTVRQAKPLLSRGYSGDSTSSSADSKSRIRRRSPASRNMARNGTRDLDPVQREPLIAKRDDLGRVKKEESIRRKLKTYEMILALKQGYMPSTEQLMAWARYVLRNSSVLDARDRRLSPQGRQFVRDLRAWVEAVAELALSKNEDDKIQEFIWHTSHAHVMGKVPSVQGAAKGTMLGSGSDLQKAFSRLRLLANLLYSSPEFRKLLNDFSLVTRDIFADAATSLASTATIAAEKTRPSDQELSQVEKSAESASNESKKAPGSPPSVGRVSAAAKEKGAQYVDVARRKGIQSRDEVEAYLREKFPKQRTDAIINRLKQVVGDIQQNRDWQETMEFLWSMIGEYVQRIGKGVMEGAESAKTAERDEHFEVAMKDAKAILMVFADGRPFDGLQDALQRVVEDVQNDHELKEFYNDALTFFKRLLTEKAYVTSDAADAEAHQIYQHSQQLLQDKEERYRPDVERLFDEVKAFADAVKNDRETVRVVETSKKVFNDLVILDSKGNFKGWRKKVLRDLGDVMLPKMVDEVKYVPVPRVEYQDRDWDVILENVVLESEHFIPYRTVLEAFTKAEYINDYIFTSKYSATTRVRMENINLYTKDASFIVRKKTGLFPFTDRGYFDIFMDGRGASAEIILDAAADDEDEELDTYYHVRSVKVYIHHFNYNYNAYHSWAAALLSPIIRPMVRNLLAKVLEEKIREAFEQADREIHALVERMRVASIANQGGGSVEAWIRAVLSRPGGPRRRRREGEWRVNVGDERLFPGEHTPGSIVGKIKKIHGRVDEQGECEGWRNGVFDTSIPI